MVPLDHWLESYWWSGLVLDSLKVQGSGDKAIQASSAFAGLLTEEFGKLLHSIKLVFSADSNCSYGQFETEHGGVLFRSLQDSR